MIIILQMRFCMEVKDNILLRLRSAAPRRAAKFRFLYLLYFKKYGLMRKEVRVLYNNNKKILLLFYYACARRSAAKFRFYYAYGSAKFRYPPKKCAAAHVIKSHRTERRFCKFPYLYFIMCFYFAHFSNISARHKIYRQSFFPPTSSSPNPM